MSHIISFPYFLYKLSNTLLIASYCLFIIAYLFFSAEGAGIDVKNIMVFVGLENSQKLVCRVMSCYIV